MGTLLSAYPTNNAQSAAIIARGKHPSPEAKAFLEDLQKDERYIDDPVLKENEAFKMALQFATKVKLVS